jgi:hypothetical protein
MSERKKTITIPDGPVERKPVEPFLAFAGGDSDERDVSLPVGYDEQGRPLYAPRGFTFRLPQG